MVFDRDLGHLLDKNKQHPHSVISIQEGTRSLSISKDPHGKTDLEICFKVRCDGKSRYTLWEQLIVPIVYCQRIRLKKGIMSNISCPFPRLTRGLWYWRCLLPESSSHGAGGIIPLHPRCSSPAHCSEFLAARPPSLRPRETEVSFIQRSSLDKCTVPIPRTSLSANGSLWCFVSFALPHRERLVEEKGDCSPSPPVVIKLIVLSIEGRSVVTKGCKHFSYLSPFFLSRKVEPFLLPPLNITEKIKKAGCQLFFVSLQKTGTHIVISILISHFTGTSVERCQGLHSNSTGTPVDKLRQQKQVSTQDGCWDRREHQVLPLTGGTASFPRIVVVSSSSPLPLLSLRSVSPSHDLIIYQFAQRKQMKNLNSIFL